LKKDLRVRLLRPVEVQQASSAQFWVWLCHSQEQLSAAAADAGTVNESLPC